MSDHRGPVLIEIDEDAPSPASAPPIDEAAPLPEGRAMQVLSTLGRKRRGSWLTRWFWGGVVALLGFVLSIAAWDFATGLLAANPVLGWIATGLIALVVVTLLLIALRELAAFSRLGRLDALHREAVAALAADDVKAARADGPLDAAAGARSRRRRGRSATVTALVPLALADVAAALTANLRMIRRIAEIYGGRAGTLGAGG
jgi:putative membrane protein